MNTIICTGWQSNVINAFRDGFPDNWLSILSNSLQLEVRKSSSVQQKLNNVSIQKDPPQDDAISLQASQNNEAVAPKKQRRKTTPALAKGTKKNSRCTSLSKGQEEIPEKNISLLPRTRSGRKVVPPLAFWMNEYKRSSMNGDIVIIRADEPSRLSQSKISPKN